MAHFYKKITRIFCSIKRDTYLCNQDNMKTTMLWYAGLFKGGLCSTEYSSKMLLFFSISHNFTFSPMNALLYVDKDLGIHKVKKY